MPEKVIGYVILVAGMLIALVSTFNVYTVFTRKSMPISLFSLPAVTIDLSSALPPEVRAQLRNENTKAEIFSARDLNFSLNIFAHLMLMGFILNLGIKFAGLGIQLLRPIEVKLKTKES